MNVTKKILAMLFVASLFVFTGCTKDDDDNAEQMRVENLLVAKAKWDFDKISEEQTTNPVSQIWIEAFTGSSLVFKDDGSLSQFKDNVESTGNWSLSTDGKKLTYTVNITRTPTIINISSSSMTLEFLDGEKKIWVFYK